MKARRADCPAGHNDRFDRAVIKVPEVTLLFWVIKIAATTLGETGGDAVSMSMKLGYLVSTAIFAVLFAVVTTCQIRAKAFHPFLYWATVIATTTVGTTLADFAVRSLGIGYAGGTSLLFVLLIVSLLVWQRTMEAVSVESINTPKAAMFYWITILFSQTLGTALGDWTADSAGLGYSGSALVVSGLLTVVVGAYYFTKVSHTILFWTAFILTRPVGAVVGDLLDKPVASGGLALSRFSASAALLVFIIACLMSEYGITGGDLGIKATRGKRKTGGSPAAAKFQDPETGATWTGRGRAPAWIAGKDRSKYRM